MSPPSDLPLFAKDVVRSFGSRTVLRGVSLELKPGRIHALLGPNGAGKTTLTKICAGMLLPDTGTVRASGIDLVRHPQRARSKIGLVLGGQLGFYGRATARDNLLFFADIGGVRGGQRRERVEEVLAIVRLEDAAHRKVREFSRGMAQRLHLARALLAAPPLLLLDEVTSGLDPDIARDVRGLIAELGRTGTAVLLTTHLLTEVEALAHDVSLLLDGAIHVRGRVADVIEASGVTHVSTFTTPVWDERMASTAAAIPDTDLSFERSDTGHSVTIAWRGPASESSLHSVFARDGHAIPVDLSTRRATLEEAYLALVARNASLVASPER